MSDNMKWLKSQDTIDFSISDSIARITLNRPEKRNALSSQTIRELHQAFLEADDRRDANVILLSGNGKDFCAGYDLSDSYGGKADSGPDYDPSQYRSRADTLDDDIWNLARQQDQTLLMLDLHKPIIAKIQGNCLAGGTDLAFSCDIVLAAETAKIGFPAARANGTPPTNLWFYHCGPQWTKRMLFTGDTITGGDAARIGLALEAWPDDEIDAAANEMAQRIAAVDAEILATHKRAVNMQMELAGAKLSQRYTAELDARAHLSTGPRRTQFRKDMVEADLKTALTNRDAPFGKGPLTLHARAK